MKKQTTTRRSLATLALAALLLGLLGCSQQEEFKRSVPLEGQNNFRDIGGYETADGRTVKTGVLYRSGEMQALTDGDVQKLKELGIRTVVSFLTPSEIAARGGDRVPEGTKEVLLSIEAGGGMVAEASKARRTGDFSKVPADLNPRFHEILASEAKAQYAALIREIIRTDSKPLVYHCSHGIHRTGTATAIVLSALGVPWKTVREDYLLSNDARAAAVEKRLPQLRAAAAKTFGIPEEEVDMTNIKAFYILQGNYIDGTLKQIRQDYGSIDGYLTEGLGLSAAEVTLLRKQLIRNRQEITSADGAQMGPRFGRARPSESAGVAALR